MNFFFLKNENESQLSTDESETSSRSPGNKPNNIKPKAAPWNSFLPPPPPSDRDIENTDLQTVLLPPYSQ